MGGSATSQHTAPHLQSADELAVEDVLLRGLANDREELERRLQMVQDLVAQRDQARDQVKAIQQIVETSAVELEERERELAEKEKELEAQENELADAKLTLARKDARIEELEARGREQEEQVKSLEATLKMLAEADEKLKE